MAMATVEAKEAETAEKNEDEAEGTASLLQLFRYATPFDVACMFCGFVGSGAVGAAQPCMMVCVARAREQSRRSSDGNMRACVCREAAGFMTFRSP